MTDPSKIIVALDFATRDEALALAELLSPIGVRFKIGMELFNAVGPAVIADIQPFGEIFLDLKLHDIPGTMARTSAVLSRLGVWMFNVHAAAGEEALQAVMKTVVGESAKNGKARPLVCAVTVLTSLKNLDHLGVGEDVAASVLRLARLASDCGLDGVVCSPREVVEIKKHTRPDFMCVTPGIRGPQDIKADQTRTLTASEAMAAGSDYLVIGRPITRAQDPLAVVRGIMTAKSG